MNADLEHTTIGIDLGGTKIVGVAMSRDAAILARERVDTPRGDYEGTIQSIVHLVNRLERRAVQETGFAALANCRVGVGMPGSISPRTGLVQNANSTWLNGRTFQVDLAAALERDLRLANDANCFALSEASDGAGVNARSVFGVILGTGCGGGLVHDAKLIDGPRGIGGEWGHNPLPWARPDEILGPACWCGQNGCMETWVSGPAITADHARVTGTSHSADDIARLAGLDDHEAEATLIRHASRLARGLAAVVNLFDPDMIVLGGGLSNMAHLYDQLPEMMAPYIFADDTSITICPPKWGDASGVRGAARLWW